MICTALACCSLAACQSTTRIGDRYYEKGRLPEAAAAFEVYLESEPSDSEAVVRTLFRLGVIFATPSSSVWDPSRSIEVFELLIGEYPESPYAAEARLIRDLQLRISKLQTESSLARDRLVSLEGELEDREAQLRGLEARVSEKEEEISLLREELPPLRLEIRSLIRELAAKELELEQLERIKAIDLGEPPT